MVRQQLQPLGVAPRSEILERADADVARGHTRQDSAGQHRLASYRLSGRDCGQRPGGGHAQRGHGLADDVLTQHRAECSAAVAIAGEGRPSGTLELDVAPRAGRPDDLAKQDGTAIAELWHEMAELVPCIGECDWRRTLRDVVAGKDLHALAARQFVGIETKTLSQLGVHT
jgi:hypothetical protein